MTYCTVHTPNWLKKQHRSKVSVVKVPQKASSLESILPRPQAVSHESTQQCFCTQCTDTSTRLGRTSSGKFLYSAVSSPQYRSKRFTLYFPDRPVHSDTISASLGSIQTYATINARRLLVHISTTVYSQLLIYTAE